MSAAASRKASETRSSPMLFDSAGVPQRGGKTSDSANLGYFSAATKLIRNGICFQGVTAGSGKQRPPTLRIDVHMKICIKDTSRFCYQMLPRS